MGNSFRQAATGRWGVALLVLAGLSVAHLAPAIPISVTIYDTNSKSWTMSADDPRILVLQDVTDRTGLPADSRTTDVLKVVRFDSTAPIKITFTQDDFATESYGGSAGGVIGARSGLNFDLQNRIFNFTGIAWTGFEETVKDRDRFKDGDIISEVQIPDSFGAGDHPTFSHFHPISGTNPPVHNQPNWELLNDTNGADRVAYGKGDELPGDGGEFNFNIKIHDIVITGFQRRFDLLETPVPTPATLALFALALAAMGFMGHRRSAA